MKESKLGELIVDALCLAKTSKDAIALKNWTRSDKKNVVDFADVAYWIMRERSQITRSNLTTLQVNDLLNK